MKSLRGCLLAAAFCAFSAGAAPAKGGAASGSVRADVGLRQYGFLPAKNSGGVLFTNGRSILRLTPEKPFCTIDGIKVYQCFPSHRGSGGIVLSGIDLRKTVAPLSQRRDGVFRHRISMITVDPGHGGRDRGAAGRSLIEKRSTLMLAKRVAAILHACGYRVHLTRTGDYYVPLAERCRIQRKHKSDLFVSIHVNAAVNPNLRGIETYALTPAGAPSTSGGPPLNRSFSGNILDGNNMLLAYSIQQSLLRRTGAVDRGVKRARFAVLKDIAAPGVLVEVGFISNPGEERLLLNAVYRERIARGIVEGIIVYHRMMMRR